MGKGKKQTAAANATGTKPSTQINVGNRVLLSKDVDQAIDEMLLGIFKELPYYSPVQQAIHKALVELLKKAVPVSATDGHPGERPDKNGGTENPHP